MREPGFIMNSLADPNSIYDEHSLPSNFKLTLYQKLLNMVFRGTYLVIRCGFYSGNFWIDKKDKLFRSESTDYTDQKGCNGIPWIAFEGTYSECKEWQRQNQTYWRLEY